MRSITNLTIDFCDTNHHLLSAGLHLFFAAKQEVFVNNFSTSARLLAERFMNHAVLLLETLCALIAIKNKILLYTDNISDYDFIKELKLYKP